MANWCLTRIEFFGNKDSLEKLKTLITKAEKVQQAKWYKDNINDRTGLWLGSIALAMTNESGGLTLCHDSKTDVFAIIPMTVQPPLAACDDFIRFAETEPSSDDDLLRAEITSKWAPPMELIEAIEAYCGVSTDWVAAEPNAYIFINTNPFKWPGIFDLHTSEKDYHPSSEEELLQIVNDNYGLKVTSYDELRQKIASDISGKLKSWYVYPYSDRHWNPWYQIRKEQASAGNA